MSDDTQRLKRPTHVSLEAMQKEVATLRGDVVELRDEVVELGQVNAGYDVRFDNGRKTMQDMKEDIAALKPKAPDWQKLLLAGFSIIAVLMGAQLWITEQFNQRVTSGALEKRLAPVELRQDETAREIKRILQAQAAQQKSLENIEKSIGDIAKEIAEESKRKRR